MPTNHPLHPQLGDAFLGDLAAAWTCARHLHPAQTPYAFVLYGVESPTELRAHVLTEERLTRAAQPYLAREDYDTPDRARHALRWSVADAPEPTDAESLLPEVAKLFGPLARDLGEIEGYGLLADAATEALATLDAQGLFGRGLARDAILLMILVEGTDLNFTDASVQRLNSPAAYHRFKTEGKPEGTHAECQALAASPGGGSVYLAEKRPGPADTDLTHLIAFSRHDGNLTRRWSHPLPAQYETVREITCAPDGSSLYVLRTRNHKGKERSTLTRFGRHANEPLAEVSIPHRAFAVAVSPDAQRVAVAGAKRTLHLFDPQLAPIRQRLLADNPFALRFLPTGELLIACGSKVIRLDPASDAPPAATAHVSAYRLSVDFAGQTAVISPMPNAGVPKEKEIPQVPTLLQLPTLTLLRTISLPGHDLANAILSPDARLIACEAQRQGTCRGPAVLFDAATGQEIARQKVDQVTGLAFTPNPPSLLIGLKGMLTGESVKVWSYGT